MIKFNSSRTKGHDQVFAISCAWVAYYFQTNYDVIRTDVFHREKLKNNNRIQKDCLFSAHVVNRNSHPRTSASSNQVYILGGRVFAICIILHRLAVY